MRTLILILLCVLSISCAKKYENIENKDSDYQVIPKPVKLTATKGRFLVDQDVKVSGEASLNQEKSYLAEMLSLATGKTITTSDNAEEDQNQPEGDLAPEVEAQSNADDEDLNEPVGAVNDLEVDAAEKTGALINLPPM